MHQVQFKSLCVCALIIQVFICQLKPKLICSPYKVIVSLQDTHCAIHMDYVYKDFLKYQKVLV